LDRLQRIFLASAEPASRKLGMDLESAKGKQVQLDSPVLCGLANEFLGSPLPFDIKGKPDVGFIFSENSTFSPAAVERGKKFARVVAGSSWGADVLRRHGLERVGVVLQGIDPTIFHPAQSSQLWKDRFVIFSGGKLEYRKGQDIVVAAVKEFQKRHPETVLMFAWHNTWPQTMKEIECGGLVQGSPAVGADGQIDFTRWLKKHEMANFIDLGPMTQQQLAPMIREADVAVFPNRCEGGTNLVAMECMACGVPTVLSANTGHLDLVSERTCFPLSEQRPAKATASYPSVEGWGESSIGELVQTLERIYIDRDEASRRGASAAAAMQELTWDKFTDNVLAEIRRVL
jgi:glycosyltransferase involved in cell wall biosynthesis